MSLFRNGSQCPGVESQRIVGQFPVSPKPTIGLNPPGAPCARRACETLHVPAHCIVRALRRHSHVKGINTGSQKSPIDLGPVSSRSLRVHAHCVYETKNTDNHPATLGGVHMNGANLREMVLSTLLPTVCTYPSAWLVRFTTPRDSGRPNEPRGLLRTQPALSASSPSVVSQHPAPLVTVPITGPAHARCELAGIYANARAQLYRATRKTVSLPERRYRRSGQQIVCIRQDPTPFCFREPGRCTDVAVAMVNPDYQETSEIGRPYRPLRTQHADGPVPGSKATLTVTSPVRPM
jgi:hypothetical protein